LFVTSRVEKKEKMKYNLTMKKKELTQILQEGEGQFVEFKEKLDNSLVKEIVAFSNASGGKILLGVDDSGKIKGISITCGLWKEL
jgi:ATP-dependent DNA helicase RecG